MLDIQTEFGGTPPIGLNEYYAGGANVPAGTAGVPTSGTISMDNLRGKTKAVPVDVSVNFSSRPEGNNFIVNFSAASPIYGALYWRLTNYINLQDADFNITSGVSTLNGESLNYDAIAFNPVTDASFEGAGTFRVSVYSDSGRTTLVGESGLLTVTDTFSTSMVAPTNNTLYRYANRNPAYRASVVSMDTTGLLGATIYYEVYTDSGSLTSADVDAPVTLTGTLTVPAGGRVSLTVRSTEWNGSVSITVNKNVFVRYRLNNASGAVLGTSSAITLLGMPVPNFSFSPTTIREGQVTTVTGSITNIPYDGGASIFWSQTGTAAAADWINGAGDPGGSSGELIWTSQIISFPIYAALDSLTESDETLTFTWRLNSSSGTGFWAHNLTIQSPAQITTATANSTTVQISNISSYPASRTFTVNILMDSSLNTASSLTVPANQTSSNSINPFSYTATSGTAGTYNMEYRIINPNYQTFTVSRFPETFIFPVYGIEFFFTGANANATARTLVARITSVPSLGYARTFNVEFQGKVAGAATWNPWAPIPGNVVLTVPANATSSVNTTLYSATSAGQFDYQFRVIRGGHETKLSPVFNSIWL